MASEKELGISYIYASASAKIFATEARWSEDTNSLRREASSKKKQALAVITVVSRVVAWLSFAIAIYRFFLTSIRKSHKVDISLQMLYVFSIVGHYIGCTTLTAWTLGESKLVLLFNELTRLGRQLGSSQVNFRREKLYIYAKWLYMAAAWPGLFFVTALEAHYAWMMTSSIFWTLLYATSVLCVYTMALSLLGLLPTYVFLYFAIVKHILREWNQSVEQREDAELQLQTGDVGQKVLEYRSLTVLCNYFNGSFCRLIVPIHKFGFCALFMICIAISILMKDGGSMELFIISRMLFFAGLYSLLVVGATAQMMSELWSLSSESIWNFKHQKGENERTIKLIRSYAKSFPTLRFGVGDFYYMERKAKLTLASLLLKGTGDILIAFK